MSAQAKSLNERLDECLDDLWCTLIHMVPSSFQPVCQIIGRKLISAHVRFVTKWDLFQVWLLMQLCWISLRLSDSELAQSLCLHQRDIREHCNILKTHGLLLSEEARYCLPRTDPPQHQTILKRESILAEHPLVQGLTLSS